MVRHFEQIHTDFCLAPKETDQEKQAGADPGIDDRVGLSDTSNAVVVGQPVQTGTADPPTMTWSPASEFTPLTASSPFSTPILAHASPVLESSALYHAYDSSSSSSPDWSLPEVFAHPSAERGSIVPPALSHMVQPAYFAPSPTPPSFSPHLPSAWSTQLPAMPTPAVVEQPYLPAVDFAFHDGALLPSLPLQIPFDLQDICAMMEPVDFSDPWLEDAHQPLAGQNSLTGDGPGVEHYALHDEYTAYDQRLLERFFDMCDDIY